MAEVLGTLEGELEKDEVIVVVVDVTVEEENSYSWS